MRFRKFRLFDLSSLIYDIFSYENFFYAHRFSEGKASF